jgi:hypothetical protein
MSSHSRYVRGAASIALAAAVAIPGIALAAGSARSNTRSRAHIAAGRCHVSRRTSVKGSPTSITFVNHDRGAVGVYWLNYQGYLQWYETLVPKQSVVQHTFKNNPWVMLNSSFSCVGYVNPTGEAKYIVH